MLPTSGIRIEFPIQIISKYWIINPTPSLIRGNPREGTNKEENGNGGNSKDRKEMGIYEFGAISRTSLLYAGGHIDQILLLPQGSGYFDRENIPNRMIRQELIYSKFPFSHDFENKSLEYKVLSMTSALGRPVGSFPLILSSNPYFGNSPINNAHFQYRN